MRNESSPSFQIGLPLKMMLGQAGARLDHGIVRAGANRTPRTSARISRQMPSNTYKFVEQWTIPDSSPQEVYEVLSDARLLPDWWKGVYLATEPLDGAWTAPRVGQRSRAIARGFLPYKLYFVLETTILDPGRTVGVRIWGDLDGTWRATLSAYNGGTRVDIEEQVIAEKPLLRLLSPLLKPLFAWNHFWTTPRGETGLRSYLAERRAAR